MSAVGWGGIGYPQRDFLVRVASEEPDSSEGPGISPIPLSPSNPEGCTLSLLEVRLPGAWGPVGIQEVGWRAGQAKFLGVGVTWPRKVSATDEGHVGVSASRGHVSRGLSHPGCLAWSKQQNPHSGSPKWG